MKKIIKTSLLSVLVATVLLGCGNSQVSDVEEQINVII